MRTIRHIVDVQAAKQPAAVWLIAPETGRVMNYAQLQRDSRELGRYLVGLGLGKGDKVALMLHNSYQTARLLIGVMYGGFMVAPLNLLAQPSQLGYVLEHSDTRLVFTSAEFGFVSLPAEYTTGSSIMPNKRNPDVIELMRASYASIAAARAEIEQLLSLPSGYHRDLQILKEKLFPAFITLKECLRMTCLMLTHIEVKKNILDDEKYKYLFSVEEVNKLVLSGIPFRDAYRQIGQAIEKGEFHYTVDINHTHEGSIGNLCNDQIIRLMKEAIAAFDFEKANNALKSLLSKT